MGKSQSSGLCREYWRRVICLAHMRKSLQDRATDNYQFCFSVNILGGNFPKDYSSSINIRIKSISNFIDAFKCSLANIVAVVATF